MWGYAHRQALRLSSRGVVQNILFENFYVEGAAAGPSISENSGNNGT